MNAHISKVFLKSVTDTIAANHLLQAKQHVYVSFSGGADSTALLLAMQAQPVDITAVHLHHGIRGAEADQDAEWCRNFCEARGIRFRCTALDVPHHIRPGESLEQAARRCRLEYWQQVAADRKAARGPVTVALGHHADDALEDLFLRLGRGSSVSGLTALRPDRLLNGIRFIRPLLDLRRDDICQFLKEQKVDNWRVDTTNRDTRHRRNAVRHQLLPVMREIWGHDRGFFQALKIAREESRFLEEQTSAWQGRELTPQTFRRIPPALQHRVLRDWLARQLGHDFIPRRQALERLRRAVRDGTAKPREIPLGSGLVLEIDRQSIQLQGQPNPGITRHWNWQKNPVMFVPELNLEVRAAVRSAPPDESRTCLGVDCEVFDATGLPDLLQIRYPQPGDRMIPFGHASERKLKDVFNASGLPPLERRRVPLLIADEQIIWAIGVRRSALAIPADSATASEKSGVTAPTVYFTVNRKHH